MSRKEGQGEPSQRERRQIGFFEKLGGYANFYLGDGKKIYQDPELYDAVVYGWLGRENLARGTADVVERNALSIGAKRVLDVGAGTGVLTLQLAQRGLQVTATDIEQNALTELNRKAAEQNLSDRIATIPLNFNDTTWPFEPESYPVVATLRANRYIENFDGFLRNVMQTLEPGGRFILPVFSLDIPTWKQHSRRGVHQPTRPNTLKKELSNVGFEVDNQESRRYSQAIEPAHKEDWVPFFYRPSFIVARKPGRQSNKPF